MPIVSMSLDDATLRRLDDVARRRKYRSRSEAVRDALHDFIDATEWDRDAAKASIVLAVVYEKGNAKADLAFLQHRFDEIRTMLHTHLDDVNCLQLLVAEGATARLKELIAHIRRVKGVRTIRFIETAVGP
ncbi:MAG TPA: CopG family ribbon-helix-helix protein [Thermoplasmata archaeon]|jgi:CopG family nickel-responsive transcriptional regulator|nr:CopG family ribbon-helix-helix protein [Thermoplasmata archaeon]